jgi:hypothetical protein
MIDDLQITQEARNTVRALSHNFAIAPKSSQQQTNGEIPALGLGAQISCPAKVEAVSFSSTVNLESARHLLPNMLPT